MSSLVEAAEGESCFEEHRAMLWLQRAKLPHLATLNGTTGSSQSGSGKKGHYLKVQSPTLSLIEKELNPEPTVVQVQQTPSRVLESEAPNSLTFSEVKKKMFFDEAPVISPNQTPTTTTNQHPHVPVRQAMPTPSPFAKTLMGFARKPTQPEKVGPLSLGVPLTLTSR